MEKPTCPTGHACLPSRQTVARVSNVISPARNAKTPKHKMNCTIASPLMPHHLRRDTELLNQKIAYSSHIFDDWFRTMCAMAMSICIKNCCKMTN